MKKIIALTVLLVFIPFSAFADVSGWAEADMERAVNLGFVSDELGIADFTESITREKFCELGLGFLRTSVRSKISKIQPEGSFLDTVNEKILILSSAGIIAGRGDGLFAPDDFITREEAAAILRRMADFMGYGLPEAGGVQYSDFEEISLWARNDVCVMFEMGVMNGVSDTEFSPKTAYTAEQAVSTMVRLFEYYEQNLLFVDGETMVTPGFSVKYNTGYCWVEKGGEVIHKSSFEDAYGYKCFFNGDDLRVALLLKAGVSEVYDSGFESLLFTLPGIIESVDENGITVTENGEAAVYTLDGE